MPRTNEVVQMIINVEAQNDFYPGYPIIKRGIYYCARMISSQYGTVFTKSHYEKIQKVYSVWICMNPPKQRNNTITAYSFSEKNLFGCVQEKSEYYDLMTAVMICLGVQDENTENDLLRLLDVLLSSDKKATEKKKLLESDFDIPMTEKMEEEVERMCNLSDGVEQRGLERGLRRGIEQGVLQAKKNLVINMLKEREEIDKICRIVECDAAFVKQIQNELISENDV